MITEFDNAVDYLNRTTQFTKKNPPDIVRAYLKRLGDPQQGIRIVHVAGTNGKGSVCSYIASCLREAGFSVGLFVSPHLTNIRERMTIDGEMISKEEFLAVFNEIYAECETAMKDGLPHPLYFEYLFLMAMMWFQRRGPQYVVLETGIGGRLDATNSIPDKELTVITRIGLDHTIYLGNTLAEVAGEKAGILRKGCPAVYLTDPAEAYEAIRARAEEAGAVSVEVSPDMWEVHGSGENGIDFSLYNRYDKTLRVTLPVRALYQCENAALAVTACRILLGDTAENTVTGIERILRDGLRGSFWPGRMEEILPGVYIDGAHNPDGMRAFLESVRQICLQEEKSGSRPRRFLLFSCVRDKEYREELNMIGSSGLFTDIVAVPMGGERALSAQELRAEVNKSSGGVIIHPALSVEDAVQRFIMNKDKDSEVFAAGSLYLIGEIRGLIAK